jgi:uncharacterized protein (TIGR03382 family)
MHKHITAAAVAALTLPLAASAQTLVDFGTDPGQVNNTNDSFDYSFGTGSFSYSADTLDVVSNPPAGFNSFGVGVELVDKVSFSPSLADSLTLTAAFDGVPTSDIFEVQIVLLDADGNRSSYNFTNKDVVPGSDPAFYLPAPIPTDGTPVTVVAQTDLANPLATQGDGFEFGVDVLDEVQVIVLNGFTPGTSTLLVDSIGVQPIPEPATLGLGLVGLAGLVRRRR